MENESLSGGRAFLYLSNNTLRLKNKGMLKPDKEYGINGNIISAVYYKSRTNASNVDIELIFDKQNGFSQSLTLLHNAINANIVKKQGNKFIIPGHEDCPFSKKTFCEVAFENPMLIVTLYNLMLPYYQQYLGTKETLDDDDDDRSKNDTLDDFLDDDF